MSLKVACEHCGKVYALDESLAGKKARCGQCQRSFRIPKAGTDFTDDDVIADAPPPRIERITLRGAPPVWPTEPGPGFPTTEQAVLLAVGFVTVVAIVSAVLFVPSKELRNDPNDVPPRWLGLAIIGFGAFIGFLAIGNFDHFFLHRRVKILSLLLGRMGARIVIMMIGGVAIAVGIDMLAGASLGHRCRENRHRRETPARSGRSRGKVPTRSNSARAGHAGPDSPRLEIEEPARAVPVAPLDTRRSIGRARPGGRSRRGARARRDRAAAV